MKTSDYKKERMVYYAVWVVAFLWALLSETEILPSDYLPDDPQSDYYFSLLDIVLTLGGTFLALRVMASASVRKKMKAEAEEKARQTYRRCCGLRTALLALALSADLTVYYGLSVNSSAKYCLLIAFLALLFCRPSSEEYDRLRENASQELGKNGRPV